MAGLGLASGLGGASTFGGGGKGKGGGGKNGSLLSLPGNIIGGATRGKGGGKGGIPGMMGSSAGKMGGKMNGLGGFPGMMSQMGNMASQGGQQLFPWLNGVATDAMGKPLDMLPGESIYDYGNRKGQRGQQPQQQPGFTGQGSSGQNHLQGLGQAGSAYGSNQPGQSMGYTWGSGSSGSHGIGQSSGGGQSSQGGASGFKAPGDPGNNPGAYGGFGTQGTPVSMGSFGQQPMWSMGPTDPRVNR